MAEFLSHLVQRTLAVSSTMMPRLAGPYEGAREAAVTRAGDGGEEATATLRFSRGQAKLRAESSAPVEGISREASASAGLGHPVNAHRQPADPTLPVRAEAPTALDLHEVQFGSRADAVAAAISPLRVPSNRPESLDSEASTAPRQRANANAPEVVEPSHTPSPPVASRWPAEVPPMQPPALHQGDLTASQIGGRTPLDDGESPRSHSTEPFGTPRFDPTGLPSELDAEGDGSQSSIVPSIDPSPTIRTVQPKQGMLVEPPAARPSTTRHTAGDAQLLTSSQPSATPTVHVTIGRIELRGSAPATAPAPSRPTENRPALSLADYLERRATAGPR